MNGSFTTQANMIQTRNARRSGSIQLMLAAMCAMLPSFIRGHRNEEPADSNPGKTEHGLNVDPNLRTAHLRFAPIDHRGSKRAHRRNRHRLAA